MKKINFAFGIHNHQPVGNFDHVFESAYQHAYLPFFDVFEQHPKIKMALHFTGILLEWILNHHPDFIPRVRKLVKSGQLEMMTGGFYEPIMMTIPDEDKFGQIDKLSKFVSKHTGYKPQGMWLAERVWEPHLPKPLAQAGIKYTVVDDAHFKYAGLRNHELYGYYVTEHNGYTLNIFPISEKLRYTMPFREPEETLEYMQSIAIDSDDRLVVFADDGEKFGVWPETYEHCYEEKWLDRFFSLIEENLDWINLVHFSTALQQLKPIGRVYLPTASYREMGEWALPAPAIHEYEDFDQWLVKRDVPKEYLIYVRGGFWRNFLAKYPEANNLHKKMLRVSRRYRQIANERNSKKLEKASDHLYAGQCNCPYWHGVFGGLYLNYLRYAIYNNLIGAENILDQVEKNKEQRIAGWANAEVVDFDGDGREEVLVETDRINAYFMPDQGGCLFELDYKPKSINLLDTMTRREEGYHKKLHEIENQEKNSEDSIASIHDVILTKEEGLEKYLHYDWYRRSSLIDHFLHENTKLDDFAACKYGEQGDFVNQPYSYRITNRSDKLETIFTRKGQVWTADQAIPIQVSKRIVFPPHKDEMIIHYSVKNLSKITVPLWFGIEFNFALLAGNAPDRYYIFPKVDLEDNRLASVGEVHETKTVKLRDEWLKIEIGLVVDQPCTVWRFPIETISMSEGGFERVYQNSVVFPNWKFELDGLSEWRVTIIKQIKGKGYYGK